MPKQTEVASRESFKERALANPYDFMEPQDMEFVAREMEIIPVDATKDNNVAEQMTWGERNIGHGLMSVTDYGRHRDDCDTLADFRDMIRERLSNDMGRQYLKVMDDDKERIADRLVAISKKNGFVVLPHFD